MSYFSSIFDIIFRGNVGSEVLIRSFYGFGGRSEFVYGCMSMRVEFFEFVDGVV